MPVSWDNLEDSVSLLSVELIVSHCRAGMTGGLCSRWLLPARTVVIGERVQIDQLASQHNLIPAIKRIVFPWNSAHGLATQHVRQQIKNNTHTSTRPEFAM